MKLISVSHPFLSPFLSLANGPSSPSSILVREASQRICPVIMPVLQETAASPETSQEIFVTDI